MTVCAMLFHATRVAEMDTNFKDFDSSQPGFTSNLPDLLESGLTLQPSLCIFQYIDHPCVMYLQGNILYNNGNTTAFTTPAMLTNIRHHCRIC